MVSGGLLRIHLEGELTSLEGMMTALEGGKPDRPPVFPLVRDWCLRQVGFKVSEAMASLENTYSPNTTACGNSATML